MNLITALLTGGGDLLRDVSVRVSAEQADLEPAQLLSCVVVRTGRYCLTSVVDGRLPDIDFPLLGALVAS